MSNRRKVLALLMVPIAISAQQDELYYCLAKQLVPIKCVLDSIGTAGQYFPRDSLFARADSLEQLNLLTMNSDVSEALGKCTVGIHSPIDLLSTSRLHMPFDELPYSFALDYLILEKLVSNHSHSDLGICSQITDISLICNSLANIPMMRDSNGDWFAKGTYANYTMYLRYLEQEINTNLLNDEELSCISDKVLEYSYEEYLRTRIEEYFLYADEYIQNSLPEMCDYGDTLDVEDEVRQVVAVKFASIHQVFDQSVPFGIAKEPFMTAVRWVSEDLPAGDSGRKSVQSSAILMDSLTENKLIPHDEIVDALANASVWLGFGIQNFWEDFQYEIRLIARIHTFRCFVAANRYKLRYGNWPRSIAEVFPEFLDSMPVDIFSNVGLHPGRITDVAFPVFKDSLEYIGEPGDELLHYKVDERGVCIWSNDIDFMNNEGRSHSYIVMRGRPGDMIYSSYYIPVHPKYYW